jgi:hypothetical protein
MPAGQATTRERARNNGGGLSVTHQEARSELVRSGLLLYRNEKNQRIGEIKRRPRSPAPSRQFLATPVAATRRR